MLTAAGRAVGEARVDAVAGAGERLVGDEVGGREAELAPALVAVHDLAAQLETARPAGGSPRPPRRPARGRGCGSRRRSRRRPRAAGARPSRSARRRRAAAGRPAPCARSGSSRRSPPARAPSAPTSTSSMNSSRRALRELGVEGDHDQLLHAERGDQLGLALERRQQLRRVLRGDHRDRVRVEREHAVGAGDHLAVAEVHAVEGADRDAAPARALDVGQAGDLHGRTAYCGRARAARASPAPRSSAISGGSRQGSPARAAAATASRDLERPDRGAPQLQAVGVAEVGDQRAHVGAASRIRSRSRRAAARPSGARRSRHSCSKRYTVTIRSGISKLLAAAGAR